MQNWELILNHLKKQGKPVPYENIRAAFPFITNLRYELKELEHSGDVMVHPGVVGGITEKTYITYARTNKGTVDLKTVICPVCKEPVSVSDYTLIEYKEHYRDRHDN